jgi:retinol dehydrogenase 12
MGFASNFFYSQLFVTPKYPTQDFAGKTVIITGSNIGLGFEAAKHITRLNASKVIIACRTLSKGEKAKEQILSNTKRTSDCVEVWKLDLSDYGSVKDFAQKAKSLDRLDAVIENAGVSNDDWTFDGEDEQTIKVNVISTFLLAILLLPKLRETAERHATSTHLEIVTSEMHHFAQIKAEDNLYETLAQEAKNRSGSHFERNPLSKLMEILFVQEFVKHANAQPIVTLVNPGFCHSNLVQTDSALRRGVMWVFKTLLARTTEVGSRNLVAGVVAGPESHGKYMSDGVNQEHGLIAWITTEDGERKQKKVYEQTMAILEKISPGIRKNIQAWRIAGIGPL